MRSFTQSQRETIRSIPNPPTDIQYLYGSKKLMFSTSISKNTEINTISIATNLIKNLFLLLMILYLDFRQK